MKPIFQTSYGKGQGNCLGACVASILELDEIPEYRNTSCQLADLHNWLLERGIHLLRIDKSLNPEGDGDPHPEIEWPIMSAISNGYWIASGISPRGILHAVVMKGTDMVHDPHPEGGGIASITSMEILIPNEGKMQ